MSLECDLLNAFNQTKEIAIPGGVGFLLTYGASSLAHMFWGHHTFRESFGNSNNVAVGLAGGFLAATGAYAHYHNLDGAASFLGKSVAAASVGAGLNAIIDPAVEAGREGIPFGESFHQHAVRGVQHGLVLGAGLYWLYLGAHAAYNLIK